MPHGSKEFRSDDGARRALQFDSSLSLARRTYDTLRLLLTFLRALRNGFSMSQARGRMPVHRVLLAKPAGLAIGAGYPIVHARDDARGEGVKRRRLPALMLAFALGCSDGTGPAAGDAPGTFNATLSGALSQSVSGSASFALSQYTYDIGLAQNPGAVGFSVTITADGVRPSVGTYALAPMTSPQSSPTVRLWVCTDAATPCRLRNWGVHAEPTGAGRLQITESTQDDVVGILEADLRGEGDGSGPLLHVSARFHARCRVGLRCH